MKMKQLFLILAGILVSLALISCGKNESGSPEKTAAPEATAETASTSDDAIMKGKELYEQNACAGCHGENGRGDGPAGQALNPKPRNFTRIQDYKQGHALDDIAKTIETGIPGTAMVAYPHIMESDRKLIASFIVSLQKQ